MNDKNDERFVSVLHDEAVEQLRVIRENRVNRTPDRDGDQKRKDKTAIAIIGGYIRLRATLANEKSNELIERRLLVALPPDDEPGGGQNGPRALPPKR